MRRTCFTMHTPNPYQIAIADLIEYEDGWMLTRINVPQAFRFQGLASKLLKRVTNEADKTSSILYLSICPSGGLSHDALECWYVRNGFEQIDLNLWRRRPQQKKEGKGNYSASSNPVLRTFPFLGSDPSI